MRIGCNLRKGSQEGQGVLKLGLFPFSARPVKRETSKRCPRSDRGKQGSSKLEQQKSDWRGRERPTYCSTNSCRVRIEPSVRHGVVHWSVALVVVLYCLERAALACASVPVSPPLRPSP